MYKPMSMSKRSHQFSDICYREAQGAAAIEDKDQRKVRVSFSSDQPYLRSSFWEDPWIEVLGHAEDEVDLSRLNNGATVHYNHSRTREDRLGAVLSASTNGNKTSALIQLSERESIDDIWNDLVKGLIKNVSVGYKIHERVLVKKNDDGPDEYRVTKWEPVEISLVDIPADPTVGIGRNESVVASGALSTPANQLPHQRDLARAVPLFTYASGENAMPDKIKDAAAIDEGRRLANERIVEINQAFQLCDDTKEMRALQLRCLDDSDVSIDAVRKLMLDEIGKNKSPTGVGHFQPGHSADGILTSQYGGHADFVNVATEALLLRCGVDVENPSIHAQDIRHLSLMDIARACISQSGVSDVGKSVSRVLAGAMTTSDFPLILGNVGEKLVLAGFNNPEVGTHRIWTGIGSHRDFKETSHVAVSETPGLELVGEGGEYTYGVLKETGDKVKLATYGKIMAISRQAIINDDLGFFTEAFLSFGNSAVRNEANLSYIILTSNPVMSDGVPLFDAAHNNIGVGAALSVASVEADRVLMKVQKDESDNDLLDLTPRILLVPAGLAATAAQVNTSEFDLDDIGGHAPNTSRGLYRDIIDTGRLSGTRRYSFADVSVAPVFEVAFLDGQQEPFLEMRDGFRVDGVSWKVRSDFGVAGIDFRGAVVNAGA